MKRGLSSGRLGPRSDMEFLPYAEVVSMDEDSARAFFGASADTLVEDAGPPSRPERHKSGARLFRVWMPDVDPARRGGAS